MQHDENINELYKKLQQGINSLDKEEKYSEQEVYDELDKI